MKNKVSHLQYYFQIVYIGTEISDTQNFANEKQKLYVLIQQLQFTCYQIKLLKTKTK